MNQVKIAFAGDYTSSIWLDIRRPTGWPITIDIIHEMRSIKFLRLFFRNSEFRNRNSNFSIFQQRSLINFFPIGIFGIGNGSGIPLPMGVPEIGTKNRNSQPSKADLPSIVKNNCAHLSTSHRKSLLVLLLKFEELFDGTLGDWKLSPVSFELKEGAKPYHGRPYPIPKIHKATLMKEIDCLILIGVLKWQPSSKWASPSFIILKKDHTVRTISDFRELNNES